MVNVGELIDNPKLLEQEAESVANLCEEMINRKQEPWDQGTDAIDTAEQFGNILDDIGRSSAEDYKYLVEIGKEDF